MISLPHWPDRAIDFDQEIQTGWEPSPFRQFIFKLYTTCNLACNYCYVYEMADQSWSSKPRLMSDEVVSAAARRIRRHADKYGLSEVHITLHGGEPLLAGAEFIRRFMHTVRSILGDVHVQASMQTNGTLLTKEMAMLCRHLDIRIGVSLDGDRTANDRHRLLRNNSSTYDKTVAAVNLLTSDEFRSHFAGLLCVVDLENDPIETYEHLISLAPPTIDFLLPHSTWDNPPAGKSDPNDFDQHPYADWLIRIFNRWFDAPTQETRVRFFEEICNMLLGGTSRSEMIGLTPVDLLVIETDGSLEQIDALKVAYDGAPATNLHVMHHELDEAWHVPAIIARQIGTRALCASCQPCAIKNVCGSGLYPHRYRTGSGFLNQSVYCGDLFALITHANARLQGKLSRVREASSIAR